MILSLKLLEEIMKVIESGGVGDGVCLPSDDGKLQVVVAPTTSGMFTLHTIEKNGVTYYVGITKPEADL